MHFKISHKGKKKKDGGKQLMIFIKEIYAHWEIDVIWYIFYATQLVLL